MKLDRNSTADQRGKYALVRLRHLDRRSDAEAINEAIAVLHNAGVLTFGYEGTASEFFLVMLKDRFAGHALSSYAEAAQQHDPEYARDIRGLVLRAGPNSPFCKFPD